ncbi:MAG: hypothetical protein WCW33_05705 [Candidatus Babeliales bacterium]|jgi:trichohyalin
MKKTSLWLLLAAFALGSTCTARVNDDDEESREHKERRERHRAEREAREEQEHREREARRAEREERKKMKKEEHAQVQENDDQSERAKRKEERKARHEQERLEREQRHEAKRHVRTAKKHDMVQEEESSDRQMHRAEREARRAEREKARSERAIRREQERKEHGENKHLEREKKESTREQRRHEKELREEQEHRDREARRAERKHERDEKRAKTEKPYKEMKREAQSMREERREKRHEKRHASENREKEKTQRRHLERESKARRSEEKTKSRRDSRLRNYAEMNTYWRNKRHEKYAGIHADRAERAQKIVQWKKMRKDMSREDHAAGAYADLYKSPTWPTSALFFEKRTLLNINLDYKYACDCYGPNYAGSKSNITKLAFGTEPIRVQDVLLASKLVQQRPRKLVLNDPLEGPYYAHNEYLYYLANEIINLKGRSEEYGMSFDFSRYIISKNVAIGFEIPVLYKRNRLRMHSKLSNFAIKPIYPPDTTGDITNGAFGPISKEVVATDATTQDLAAANVFLRRYGADPVRFVRDMLDAKGMYELGGSTEGIGDVAIFINGQMNSANYDKLVVGLRALFPTGKKAAMHKLWAPDLGNGGFSEIAGFGSVLFSYAKYLNPHIWANVSFSLPAHVNRRVPRRINLPEIAVDNTVYGHHVSEVNGELATEIAFGDRMSRAQSDGTEITSPSTAAAIDDYDSSVRNFGDKATSVRITKGTEFKFRVGNMFERFMLPRAFLDMFYDFRGKLKDTATGLTADQYDVDSLVKETVQLEHRIGLDWSYQADLGSRVHLGLLYTFAGRNVPKTFELSGTYNYAF